MTSVYKLVVLTRFSGQGEKKKACKAAKPRPHPEMIFSLLIKLNH